MKKDFVLVDKLSIPSDFGSIAKVETLVDSVCERLAVNEDYYGNVLIAVTEAVNNAIEHGNMMKNELSVDVHVGDKEMDFCFNIRDKGVGFDYKNLPDPTSPENIEKENGRGIYLMKSLAEAVEFEENGASVSIYFSKK
ncbi:MAG: ATP-binding protein [Crocinitomicaceae bacterium]|nr:ATP-binding protein [Crocinitomicaceae bacterium]MDG1657594.1 ATP-binding protein [Crocinitomicaceae bacterium]MDG2440803.1 ATP-binding protein [Crocinitomicaceae bacterium]|tara:strand:+ start:4904 stop:5320 length:417 start_codon:yes stop_codon:yes gene_type:complete